VYSTYWFYSERALLSHREVTPLDLPIIRSTLSTMVDRLRKNNTKHIYKIMNVDIGMNNLCLMDHVYIVNECYLVIYDIFTPWYSETPILAEQLVLQLASGGRFSDVVSFLEEAAREAGASSVVVGTALAKSDKSLATMYQREGFQQEAIELSKEL